MAVASKRVHSPSQWDDAVEGFFREKRRANISQATVDVYTMCLCGPRTRKWLAKLRIKSPADLTGDALRTLELELKDAGLAPSTVSIYHRTLKTFARWCSEEGLGLGEKVLLLKGPKLPERDPEVFSVEDEKRLLAAARHPRDRFLVEFMLHTGLRRAEVCALTVEDVMTGPEGSWLRVRQGKGRKDRTVPLDTPEYRLSRKIATYLREVRPKQTRHRNLFLSLRRGPRGEFAAMDEEALKTTLRRLGEEAGVHCHAHKFRHTFATRAIGAGVDVLALQRVLGHTTLTMTARYAQHSPALLVDAWMARRD